MNRRCIARHSKMILHCRTVSKTIIRPINKTVFIYAIHFILILELFQALNRQIRAKAKRIAKKIPSCCFCVNKFRLMSFFVFIWIYRSNTTNADLIHRSESLREHLI